MPVAGLVVTLTELDLVRDPSEPLSDVQQAALSNALAALDVNAGDPLKLEAEFRQLAALYLNERSYNLRRAIDIHVRDRREAMLASINPGTWRLRCRCSVGCARPRPC